jgi:assimilatory nitrate reductase catalytic subunit
MTNLEGRVIRRRRAADPPAGVRTDLEIISGLAARLGCADGFSPHPREVFAELRRASAGGPADYAGITWERIDASGGVCWPCPDESHPGTPRLFTDAFATPDGRARFTDVDARPPAEPLDDEYPVRLTTGRILAHYQSGAQTRRVPALASAAAGPFVEVHPGLAGQLGAADGDLLRVTSRRGSAVAPARVTRAIRADTVFMPFHWGGDGSANLITNPVLDPVSRMPDFKSCAVRLERAGASEGGSG